MPIYEYKCQKCGNEFEALVRKSDEPACPSCKSTELERQISKPVVKSESTKAQALKAAKKRDLAIGKDRTEAQAAYERSHND